MFLDYFPVPDQPFTLIVGPTDARTHFVMTEFVHARSGMATHVHLWHDLVFVSPLSAQVLPPDIIRRQINAHSRRLKQPIHQSARDFAALLDYLLWCIMHPRNEWVPSVAIDKFWHPMLAYPKTYMALNAELVAIAQASVKAAKRIKAVGHVEKKQRPRQRFRAQLSEMHRGGAQALSEHLGTSQAAGCTGACGSRRHISAAA